LKKLATLKKLCASFKMLKQTVSEGKDDKFYNSSSQYHGFERKSDRQPYAQSYSTHDNAYNNRGNGEHTFVGGWDRSISSVQNPGAVFRKVYSPARYCNSWTSSVSNMSISPLQRLPQSSNGCRCSEAGSKTSYWEKSCQEPESDIWYETTGQWNQHEKDDLIEKNKKINELLSNQAKLKWEMEELEKRLIEAKSNTKEQARLLSDERRQRLKAEENYVRGVKKFQSLSNNLQYKNSVLKQKQEKLDGENKMLKKELQLAKDELKYREGLIRTQNRQLSGWGNGSSVSSREALRKNEQCGVEGRMGENSIAQIIPESRASGKPDGLVPRDLLCLGKENIKMKKVPSKSFVRQQSNPHSQNNPHQFDKPPLHQIFEPGRRLLKFDFKTAEMLELTDSQSSNSDKDQPLNKEVEFWTLPEPPSVPDVEKVMVVFEDVSQGDQTNESETP